MGATSDLGARLMDSSEHPSLARAVREHRLVRYTAVGGTERYRCQQCQMWFTDGESARRHIFGTLGEHRRVGPFGLTPEEADAAMAVQLDPEKSAVAKLMNKLASGEITQDEYDAALVQVLG